MLIVPLFEYRVQEQDHHESVRRESVLWVLRAHVDDLQSWNGSRRPVRPSPPGGHRLLSFPEDLMSDFSLESTCVP